MFVTYTNDPNIRTVTFSDIQIEKDNSVSTTYPPYVSTIVPISWQSEAGTVYGGSLDVTTGLLTVTHGFKTYTGASGENWQFELAAGGTQKNFYIAISDAKRPQTAQNSTMKCNLSPISNTSSAVQDACFISNGRNFNFTWGNTLNISSATDFKTWLGSNSLEVCYELETPVTYQLTPTQISAIVGTNNVFTDTNGDTSLEYYTKRGEQTVRIAEGVAVDVINNKSIDTLATTDKTVKGAINELEAGIADTYTKTEVDTALALKFDNANRVTTGTGTFAGLLNTADRVWLITAQRLSTNSTIMLIAHKQNNNFYFKEIVKDSGMEYNYNSENGSVVITYGGSTTGVYGGAYRLA